MSSNNGHVRCVPTGLPAEPWWRAASANRRLLYVCLYLNADERGVCRASLNDMVEWLTTESTDLFGRVTTAAPGRATVQDGLTWLESKAVIRRSVQGVQCVEIVQYVANVPQAADAPYTGDVPYGEILGVWNGLAEQSVLQPSRMTEKRRGHLRARWREAGFRRDYAQAFARIHASPWCGGQNPTGWLATFKWAIHNGDNYVKAIEGDYDRRVAPAGSGQRGKAGGPAAGGATNQAGRLFGGGGKTISAAEEQGPDG